MALVSLLYFASVREAVGLAGEERDVPPALETVQDLVDWLAAQDERYRQAFAGTRKLRCAVDQVVAAFDTHIAGAREIAFFPPVTGG